jgi:flavin reductase (DIM6/NTAB) family NADH-FMN oxidoreductase RutF
MTASAFMSVSLDPLLVLVSIDKNARMRMLLDRVDPFCVSILSDRQHEVSTYFAGQPTPVPPALFQLTGPDGLVVIKGSQAWIKCRTVNTIDAGDHRIYFAEPMAMWMDESPGTSPLVFCRGKYDALRTTTPETSPPPRAGKDKGNPRISDARPTKARGTRPTKTGVSGR